jgi:hypothetical protein
MPVLSYNGPQYLSKLNFKSALVCLCPIKSKPSFRKSAFYTCQTTARWLHVTITTFTAGLENPNLDEMLAIPCPRVSLAYTTRDSAA